MTVTTLARRIERIAAPACIAVFIVICAGSVVLLRREPFLGWLDAGVDRYLDRQFKSWTGQLDLAVRLGREGRTDESVAILESLLRRMPPLRARKLQVGVLRISAMEELASLYGRQAKRGKVSRLCAELVEANPGSAREYAFCGRLLMDAGREVEGEKFLLEALALDPSTISAVEALVSHYSERRRHDAVTDVWEKFNRAFSVMPGASLTLLDGPIPVAVFEISPIADGRVHEYVLSAGMDRVRDLAAAADTIQIAFPAQTGASYIALHAVEIYTPRTLGGTEWLPAVKITDFSRAHCDGGSFMADRIPSELVLDGADAPASTLNLALQEVPVRDMDRIVLVMAVSQMPGADTLNRVEQSKLAIRRDEMRGEL